MSDCSPAFPGRQSLGHLARSPAVTLLACSATSHHSSVVLCALLLLNAITALSHKSFNSTFDLEMEKYKLSATVGRKYAPLINRSRMLHEQTPKADFALYRECGASNIDLWCDGSIYPHDPVTSKRPHFRSVRGLLEFVGDGRCGLFGYVNSLRNYDSALEFRLLEAQRGVQLLRDAKELLVRTVHDKERLLQSALFELQSLARLYRENQERLLRTTEQLKCEVNALKFENEQLIVSSESRISSLNAQLKVKSDDRIQLEVDLWVEIETIKESHAKALSTCASELKRTKAALRRRDALLRNLVKTPFGCRRRIVRGRKDLSTLAPKGGLAKRTLRLARSIILPATVKDTQTSSRFSEPWCNSTIQHLLI